MESQPALTKDAKGVEASELKESDLPRRSDTTGSSDGEVQLSAEQVCRFASTGGLKEYKAEVQRFREFKRHSKGLAVKDYNDHMNAIASLKPNNATLLWNVMQEMEQAGRFPTFSTYRIIFNSLPLNT